MRYYNEKAGKFSTFTLLEDCTLDVQNKKTRIQFILSPARRTKQNGQTKRVRVAAATIMARQETTKLNRNREPRQTD